MKEILPPVGKYKYDT
jgi:hypothetical protein